MGKVKSSSPSLISRLAIIPRPAVSFSFSSTVSTCTGRRTDKHERAGRARKRTKTRRDTNVNVTPWP